MTSAIDPTVPIQGADNPSSKLRDNFAAAKSEIEALQSGKADTAHTHPDATEDDPGFMSIADKVKLSGIATEATANSPDAALRDRATHTGTQTASTISDFAAEARAQTEAELVAGANITITPSGSGATRQLTIASNAATIIREVCTTVGSTPWTKPAGALYCDVEMIASGGGGGSGRKGAAGTVRCGGGSGSPGARFKQRFAASMLPASGTVVINAPGVGGASVTTNSTNGNNGTAGGNVTFSGGGITYASADGGAGGGGGTASAGSAGAARTSYNEWSTTAGPAGVAASTTGGAGTAGATQRYFPGQGGSGGGITSGNAASAGGAGTGLSSPVSGAGFIINPGNAGAIATNGQDGVDSPVDSGFPGSGGGGGGSSLVGNAGNGGNGGDYGASGGGGGAAVDGVGNSGKGGDGGAGICVLTWTVSA